jgi:hypothetical protein
LIEYHDISVKHATSPSHRDYPRQVVLFPVFKFRGRRLIASRYAAWFSPFLDPLTASASSAAAAVRPVRISLVRSQRDEKRRALRNFDTELPSSYCYEFQPEHRWKASLTCTPPPICTYAPVLKPRWSEEPQAPRRLKKYTMRDF